MESRKLPTSAAVAAAGAAAAAAYLAYRNGSVLKDSVYDLCFKSKAPQASPRLPASVVPQRYDLFLSPDLSDCTFVGRVDVEVEIVKRTKFIILNVAEIDLADRSIKLKLFDSNTEISPTSVKLVPEDELLILEFSKALPLGKASLHIDYEGKLNDQMKGFYRSTYLINGEKKNLAVTQFEPADARRCFPCWDEPGFKAVFSVTLEIPEGHVGLSNMPVASEKVLESSRVLTFQDSPVMSTYLVAVVVGEFDFIEDETVDGIPIRVYAEKGSQEMGRFALDVAKETLPFFEEYFGVPYALPKLDMIAIPDFAAGAMENYGLVTYRAVALLVDPVSTAAANKQRIAVTVTHELAHQWFGNFVTMEWWTHLWLNEGFASWVSYLAVDHLFPEWNVWTQFTASEMATAFRLDALQNSHPIEVEVGHVREIDEIFDAISYNKGASVIRMLQSFLGADAFQAGLASYIARYGFSNASTKHLWLALAESTGQSVPALMGPWTQQMGYPLVSVRVQGGKLELSQERFLSLGVPGKGEWVVPLTGIWGSYERSFRNVMRGRTATLPFEEGAAFLKLNVGQTGFYRVQYSRQLADSLAQAVRQGLLQPSDRFGLLDDAYALSRAGKQSLGDLLRLLEAFSGESDPTVMGSICEIVAAILSLLLDALPEASGKFQEFSQKILKKTSMELGWSSTPGESHLVSMLRGKLQETLILLGEESTLEEGRRRFRDFSEKGGEALLPDLRKAAYKAMLADVSESDISAYDEILELYRKSELSEEKARILTALGSGPEPVVKRALDFLLTDDVRPQDAIFLLSGLGRSSRDVAWGWLRENWERVYSVWGEGFLISRFVLNACSSFCTEEKAQEIGAFFASRDCPPIKRTVEQCVERVRATAQQVGKVRSEEGLAAVIDSLLEGA